MKKPLLQYNKKTNRVGVFGIHFGRNTPPENFTLNLQGCKDLVVASTQYILENPERFIENVKKLDATPD